MAEVIPLDAWKTQLAMRAGPAGPELAASIGNAVMILENDAAFRGAWQLDRFTGRVALTRALPAVAGVAPLPVGELLDKVTAIRTTQAIASVNKVSFDRRIVRDAIETAAAACSYDSLTDHLNALRWDGTPRIDTWLSTYLGADDSNYTRAVGRWWLVSALARAYIPGCKADHILVLEGRQGVGKSTAAAILGGPFGSGKLAAIRDYDRAAHSIQGSWIVEVAELDAMRGAAETQIKEFLSLRSDHYHRPYGEDHITRPRRIVCIGSTNDERYSRDATGARRLWGVACRSLDRSALSRDRDLLLAEAREILLSAPLSASDTDRVAANAHWWPTDSLRAELEEQQDARYEGDPWAPRIAAWLDGHDPTDSAAPSRDAVTTGDVLLGALSVEPARWDRDAQSRVGHCLRRLGWTVTRTREHGSRVRRYCRPQPPPAHDV